MGAGRKANSSDSGLCLPGENHHARGLIGRCAVTTAASVSGQAVAFPTLGITVLGEVAAEPLHLANCSFSHSWSGRFCARASPRH